MQKPVNLLEICNLFKEKELLSDTKIKEFLQIQNCREYEIETLYILCEKLKELNDECFDVFGAIILIIKSRKLEKNLI